MTVVDASVAVKWFVTEPYHLEAVALLASGTAFFAPDLILVEVANVLRRKFKRGELTETQWREAVGILPKYFDRLIPSLELMASAVEIALMLDHPVYDCMYVAIAAASAHSLISADQVLISKCQRDGIIKKIITLDQWYREKQYILSSSIEIQKVLELYKRFETTLNFVTDLISTPLGKGSTKITRSGDLTPALDSPAYLNLQGLILGMNRRQRAELLALGWLGQGSGDDWSDILRRAEDYLSDDSELHITYLISKICLVESGLAKRKARQVDATLDDQSDEA